MACSLCTVLCNHHFLATSQHVVSPTPAPMPKASTCFIPSLQNPVPAAMESRYNMIWSAVGEHRPLAGGRMETAVVTQRSCLWALLGYLSLTSIPRWPECTEASWPALTVGRSHYRVQPGPANCSLQFWELSKYDVQRRAAQLRKSLAGFAPASLKLQWPEFAVPQHGVDGRFWRESPECRDFIIVPPTLYLCEFFL